MSLAYYIVLDNDEPGFDTFVNGKAVAHAADELEALCDELGLPQFDEFMGQSPTELAEMLADDYDENDDDEDEDEAREYDDEAWFEPHEGITLVNGLLEHLEENPDAMASAEEVLEDLGEYRSVLEQAEGIGARWHFAVDF